MLTDEPRIPAEPKPAAALVIDLRRTLPVQLVPILVVDFYREDV